MKTKEGDDREETIQKLKWTSHLVLCFNKEGMQWWQAGKVCLKVRQKERNSWRRSRLFPFLSKPDVFSGQRDRERKKQRDCGQRLRQMEAKTESDSFFSWLTEPYGLYISPRRLVVSGCIRKKTALWELKEDHLNKVSPFFFFFFNSLNLEFWLAAASAHRQRHLIRLYCVYILLSLLCVCLRQGAK